MLQPTNYNNQQRSLDEMINEVDQELQDLQTAKIQNAQLGLGIGDYDFRAATAQVRKDRVAREQAAQQRVVPPGMEGRPLVQYPDATLGAAPPPPEEPVTPPPRRGGLQQPRHTFEPKVTVTTSGEPMPAAEDQPLALEDIPVDFIAKKTFEEMDPNEQKIYEGFIDTFQKDQETLRNALIKAHPDMGTFLEKVGNLPPEERMKYFEEEMPDLSFTQKQAIEAFGGGKEGEEKLKKHVQHMDMFKKRQGYKWGDVYKTKGKTEDEFLYGGRSAALGYYTGTETPMERVKAREEGLRQEGRVRY